ncbi:MAG TPA: glycosyl hydrolase, partial [Acidobacteriaceae bacterium]|nr:glycosyl hydrolase [Acidobacteriaceae bacterium]
RVSDGRIVLDSGAEYRVLVLPPTANMTPEVARKLHELVEAGAIIAGPRPLRSPSLADSARSDAEVTALADELWGDLDGVTKNEHHFGKGVVYDGLTMDDLMQRLHVTRDFAATGALTEPVWAHRALADKDIYYIANQSDTPVTLKIELRATGRAAEIWRPMNAGRSLADATFADGLANVSLHLAERETAFIVISKQESQLKPTPHTTRKQLIEFTGPWNVTFNGPAAPPRTTLLSGQSWTESSDPALKYFSGTATYTRSFEMQSSWLRSGGRIFLDFGNVGDLADVRVNGSSAGIVWAPPYRLDVTKLVKAGANKLEIAVTNEFTNRIVGDKRLPEDKRVLGSAANVRIMFGGPKEPLPSGLLGEVRLVSDSAAQ